MHVCFASHNVVGSDYRGPGPRRARPVHAAEPSGEFASPTVDLGIVVTNLDKSVKFYTDAIGFKEAPGFSVPADFCTEAGLTDNQPLKIRVLVVGDGPTATKLKLMEVPGVESKKVDNAFVHSQLGYRYLTIHVTSGAAVAERLKKTGVKPVAKGPVALPAGLPPGMGLQSCAIRTATWSSWSGRAFDGKNCRR